LAGLKRTVASAKAAKKRALQVAAGTTSLFGKVCAPCTSANANTHKEATGGPLATETAGVLDKGEEDGVGVAPTGNKMNHETEMTEKA